MTDEGDERELSTNTRKRVLKTFGAASAAGLAGCLGDSGEGNDPTVDGPETDTNDITDTETQSGGAFFEVGGLTPVSPVVEPGDRLTVSAAVTNTGGTRESQVISVRIGDDVLATRTVGTDPGELLPVTFENVTVPDLDPGEYTYGVYSEDDRNTSTVTVESGDGEPRQVDWHRDHDWEEDPEAATTWDNYDTTELLAVDNLMSIDIAPDGRVFYITRGAPTEPKDTFVTYGHGTAEVGWVDPDDDDRSKVALERRVQVGSASKEAGSARELGGQGIALDPEFGENGRVYLYYTPAAENREPVENPYEQFYDGEVTTGYMIVSRFETRGGELLPDTEEELIRIIDQHDSCCHRGGNLQFGPEGDLYVSTGDNGGGPGSGTDPSEALGRDDRRGAHPSEDAARTAGNTADLRGSVLRIMPTEEGGNGPETWYNPNGLYEIPDGNLKESHEAETGEEYATAEFRPEIYAMGFRNPFIISLDEHTGTMFVGDYGPATQWDTDIGPVGLAAWHVICEPAFAGWPFFKGYYPYRRYDYEAGEVGQPFWPDNPRNWSRNNTGIEKLPPVTPATVWQGQDYGRYDGDPADPDDYVEGPAWLDMPRPGEVTWPEVAAGGSANAGPAYRYAESFGDGALDPYFEGKQFLMASWAASSWIGYLTFENDGRIGIDEFLPDHPWRYPTEIKYGPDGRLFVMDYSHSGEGGIHMVEYHG